MRYVIVLEATKALQEPQIRLRQALKVLSRRFAFRAVSVEVARGSVDSRGANPTGNRPHASPEPEVI